MAGGQGAVNVSLLDRLGIYLPFLIDFLFFYFFYLFLFFFSLISLQEYRILTNKVIKKIQIEYVQDPKIIKFKSYRKKNMLNSC